MSKIELGDKVRCNLSGYEGIAVSKTEFINGCVQYHILPRVKKGVPIMPEEIGIDEGSLEVITPKKKKIVKKPTGGPMTRHLRMRNY